MNKQYTANDLKDIVNNINCTLYDIIGDDVAYINCSYSTNGDIDLISFMNNIIWNSDNDERKYIDDSDEYEDLEQFIHENMLYEVKKIVKVENFDRIIKLKKIFNK